MLLIFLMSGLVEIDSASSYSPPQSTKMNTDIDPADMSLYYAMGEYYPPDNVDALYIWWQGGRVEIMAYNDDEYFVEEAATRQLGDDERLSYALLDNVFNVYYTASDDTVIDDAYKKLEIRVPKSLAQNLKSINIVSNGEIILKNISAESIVINGGSGQVSCENVYSQRMGIASSSGDIRMKLDSQRGFTLNFKSVTGILDSEFELTEQRGVYTHGNGEYVYSVETKSGSLYIS